MKHRLKGAFRQTFSSLNVPNYRLFITGQSLSTIGTWMQMATQSWLVLTLTNSSTDIGFTLALQAVPVLLLGPYGGLIADRVDKRRLMVILQIAMGVQALLLGLLTIFNVERFWEICVLAVILGLNNAFETPARQAFVREMVGKKELRNALTLNSVMINVARAIGPAIAGILIAVVGSGECFLINAASFVFVVASLIRMDKTQLRTVEPTLRDKGQVREGFRYAGRTPKIALPLVMMTITGMLAYEFQVSLPELAHGTFHGGPQVYGFMTAMLGIGAVFGGLYSAAKGRSGLRAYLIACTSFGVAILLTAFAPVLVVAYVGLFLAGWASISYSVSANSTIQLNADPNMRGRISALWQVAFQGTTPIGAPLIGWIIAVSDPRIGLAVGGIACIVAVLGALVYLRKSKAPWSENRVASLTTPKERLESISA